MPNSHRLLDAIGRAAERVEAGDALRYVLDGRTVLVRLPSHGFRVVPKLRTAHSGDELFESVTLAWRVGKGERIKLLKVSRPRSSD